MKSASTESSTGTQQGREFGSRDPRQQRDYQAAAPLPHETDQRSESQREHEPREVGEQAHRDIERGLVDTDRRGGGAYQEATQRDEHANVNSKEGGGGATPAKGGQ